MRILYRARQFWHALASSPRPGELEAARRVLSSQQMALFLKLQPSEQAHAIQVLHKLVEQGETQPDLLVAALLHDIGKSCWPLRPWERALIVLVQATWPHEAIRWGMSSEIMPPGNGDASRSPRGWQWPFIVACQHPAWGAEMSRKAGVSPLAEALIRRHQEHPHTPPTTEEDHLLRKLQAVDAES